MSTPFNEPLERIPLPEAHEVPVLDFEGTDDDVSGSASGTVSDIS